MQVFNITRSPGEMVAEIVVALAGLALVIAPWALGFTAAAAAAWNAWVVGAALFVIALVAIFYALRWEPWAFLVLGAWAIAAPWMLGFVAIGAAFWAHVVVGAIAVVVAAIALWFSSNRPMTA